MKFETENQLCEAFVRDVSDWTVYPEQGGWDLLLVRRGVQVGVQAKLVAGIEVLLQALPDVDRFHRRRDLDVGPHYRAILVGGFPGRTLKAEVGRRRELYALAIHLRVVVLEQPEPHFRDSEGWCRAGAFDNRSRKFSIYGSALDFRHYRRRPRKPVWTPPFVPTHPAGVPNPRSVSSWQLAACELERICEIHGGWVCLDDAKSVVTKYEGEWNPKTMLSRYYVCTSESVEGTRQRRWKPRRLNRASTEFPEVAEAVGVIDG